MNPTPDLLFVPASMAASTSRAKTQNCLCPNKKHARLRLCPIIRHNPSRLFMSFSSGGWEDPESKKLIEDIESTFIEACVPGAKSYADAMQDFIRSVLAAYKKGYSLTALQFELQARQDQSKRRLQADELEFRTVWISLIFKTLRFLQVPKDRPSEEVVAIPDQFDSFVKNIVQALRSGYDLNRIQLEQQLNSKEPQARSSFESAVLRQSTRLVYYTYQLAVGA